MGWLKNPFRRQSEGQQAGVPVVRPAVPPGGRVGQAREAWVLMVEDGFFHAVSMGFSGVSAFAIWQIFVSRHAGDIGRMIEGGVIAVCFGIAGYFLSRNIAYRWMSGEMVWAYIPVCLVVELVEIYCNYVVGVSYLDLTEFFLTIPLEQHMFLLTTGRVVVSSIPAMTLFLSVAQMDLERRKLVQGATPSTPQPVRPATYASGYQNRQQSRQPLREQQAAYQQPAREASQNGANPPVGVRNNQ